MLNNNNLCVEMKWQAINKNKLHWNYFHIFIFNFQ